MSRAGFFLLGGVLRKRARRVRRQCRDFGVERIPFLRRRIARFRDHGFDQRDGAVDQADHLGTVIDEDFAAEGCPGRAKNE